MVLARRESRLSRRESRLERRESRLERRDSRLARNETRGGNLLLSGTVLGSRSHTVIRTPEIIIFGGIYCAFTVHLLCIYCAFTVHLLIYKFNVFDNDI